MSNKLSKNEMNQIVRERNYARYAVKKYIGGDVKEVLAELVMRDRIEAEIDGRKLLLSSKPLFIGIYKGPDGNLYIYNNGTVGFGTKKVTDDLRMLKAKSKERGKKLLVIEASEEGKKLVGDVEKMDNGTEVLKSEVKLYEVMDLMLELTLKRVWNGNENKALRYDIYDAVATHKPDIYTIYKGKRDKWEGYYFVFKNGLNELVLHGDEQVKNYVGRLMGVDSIKGVTKEIKIMRYAEEFKPLVERIKDEARRSEVVKIEDKTLGDDLIEL